VEKEERLGNLGREERLGGGLKRGQAGTAARHLGIGRSEQADDLAEFSARRADHGRGFVEPFGRLAGREREARLVGAAHSAQSLTRAGKRVAFAMDEAFDFESHLDIATAIEALAGSTFSGSELRKLRFPETQDVGLDLTDARDVADFEIETVGDDGLFVDALGGRLRGHSQSGREVFGNAPVVNRSIGHDCACGSRKFRMRRFSSEDNSSQSDLGASDGAARGRVSWCGTEILNRPVGVTEHLAGKEDEVGLTVCDDCVGLVRIGDHAHGRGGNGSFVADACGEGSLESRADGDLGIRDQSAGRGVDEVDAVSAEEAGESNGVVDGPTLFDPIAGRDADEERKVRGPGGADCVDDLEEKACAVLEAASVRVGALIGEGREKLVEQIAVGGVDFNEVETGSEGAFRGTAEGLDDGIDAGLIERLWDGVVGCEGDGTGSNRLPAAFRGREQMFGSRERGGHGGLASGMGKLNAGANALAMDELDDALKAWNVIVFVDAEVARCDTAFGDYGRGFEHDEAGTTLGTAAEVDHVPVVGETVVGGVLAHRGDADAVGECDRTKLERREERMAHG